MRAQIRPDGDFSPRADWHASAPWTAARGANRRLATKSFPSTRRFCVTLAHTDEPFALCSPRRRARPVSRRAGARGWGGIRCRSCCARARPALSRGCGATSSTMTRRPAPPSSCAYPGGQGLPAQAGEEAATSRSRRPKERWGRRSSRRALATLRALGRLAELGLDVTLPSVQSGGGVPAVVAGEGRRHRRPGARRDARARGEGGGAALSRLGARGAVPRRARRRRARRARLQLPAGQPPGRRRLGLARRAHRLGGAPIEPPHHGHGAARLRRIAVAPHLARGAAGRRAARDPLPAARSLPRSQGGHLLGAARRAALLHRRARRARPASPPSASARRTRACARPRPICAGARSPTGSGTRARRCAATASKSRRRPREIAQGLDKDREAARWLTVRVLIVLRRMN